MKKAQLLILGLTLIMTSYGSIASAATTSQGMMDNGMMATMKQDPTAMCSKMMQGMMDDPVMHRHMNDFMRHHMGKMSMSSSDPMKTYSAMMQSMMSDPVMHRRMNEYMERNMANMQMNMPSMSPAMH